MLIIPAIDVQNGNCVRLLQGDFSRSTVYGDDPAAVARQWQDRGAQRIHVVDLDGAREGSPRNRRVVGDIVKAVDVPVQVGGGIRDEETVREYLDMGVSRVILGTAALKDRESVFAVCDRHRGSIIIGIDARDGVVAVEGWVEKTERSPAQIAAEYEQCGLDAIVYTDIGRDGMETGVNVEMTAALARAVRVPIIASGGVRGLDDIHRLLAAEAAGISGVIIGKALYTGALNLEDAIAAARRNIRRESP